MSHASCSQRRNDAGQSRGDRTSRGARLVRHQRSIRIVVARDEEGYWIARGHSEAADEELAQAAADDLAEVAETHFITVDLPGASAGGNGLGQ